MTNTDKDIQKENIHKQKRSSAQVLLRELREGQELSHYQQVNLVMRLSLPAILAQISSIMMQYIDASMVGQLGSTESAAIGLVSSTTWLFGGLCSCAAAGFYVQAAQLIGAGKEREAQGVVKQSIQYTLVFCALMMALGLSICSFLPGWLGGDESVRGNASLYFGIYILSLPTIQMNFLAGGMLRSRGDMKLCGILNVLMCVLDVIFNMIFIFPGHSVSFAGMTCRIPGFGMGVAGAALGTAVAQAITAVLMLTAVCREYSMLGLWRSGKKQTPVEGNRPGKTSDRSALKTAVRIAVPLAAERIAMNSAMIAAIRIVAPLGNIALVANSFGVTAESLCYMPGYGIGEAATTLVGQSIGAGRYDETRRMARLTVFLGMAIMTASGILMFFAAPLMFSILTPDPAVQELGVKVLRIEAFAEPLYGASIVVSGALRGAGDTLVPSIMNLISMWGVRIPLSIFLAPRFGLEGVWTAMCLELCFRGSIFLVRLYREKWLKRMEL